MISHMKLKKTYLIWLKMFQLNVYRIKCNKIKYHRIFFNHVLITFHFWIYFFDLWLRWPLPVTTQTLNGPSNGLCRTNPSTELRLTYQIKKWNFWGNWTQCGHSGEVFEARLKNTNFTHIFTVKCFLRQKRFYGHKYKNLFVIDAVF